MSIASGEILQAFITAFSANDGYVAFRQRGGSPGYVHVVPSGFDPDRRDDRHVIVELYNGTVAVTKELQDTVKAQDRPDDPIRDHLLGFSAGPNSGRFKWALAYDEIVARWGSTLAFAEEVARRYRALIPRPKR